MSEEEKTLAAGTYKITANLTVKGENNVVLPGVQIHPGSHTFPPIIAGENNAREKEGRYYRSCVVSYRM